MLLDWYETARIVRNEGFLTFAIIIVPALVGRLYSRGGMHSEDVLSRCNVIRILVSAQCYYNAQISGIVAAT